MERKSLNKMKDRSGVDSRSLTCNSYYVGDLLGGFSWPPRTYTCSFCQREFKSAQALGGHMNVHRKDRARLRQSPPWDGQSFSLNPNPNPNPNFPSLPHSTRLPPFTYTFPSILTPSSASSTQVKIPSMDCSPLDPSSSIVGDSMKTMKALRGFMQEHEGKILKKREMVMLDLKIGLCRDLNEDLDLELRLGYS